MEYYTTLMQHAIAPWGAPRPYRLHKKGECEILIGVYVDGFAPYPKYRRIIREGDGNNIVVDMVSGKKKFEVLGSTNKKGVIIDFPGDKRCNGTFNNKKGTIKYPDGNIWTRV